MSSYYINGDVGSDTTGDGSSSKPWQTLAKLFSVVTLLVGDIVNLAGTLREFNTNSSVLASVTFQQWSGQLQATLRGDIQFDAGGWVADNSGGVGKHLWKITLANATSVKSVTVGWTLHTDSSGRHYGHLKSVASYALCQNTTNSWWQDTTNNLMYVHLADDVEVAAAQTITYCLGGNDALLKLTNSTNCTFSGLNFALHCDNTAGKGYGLWLIGNGNTVTGCRFDDCGYHSIGIANGSTNHNNTFSNCTCSGIGDGGINLVFHVDTAATLSNSNNLATDCLIYLHSYLNRSGTPLNTLSSTIGACLSHTSSGGTLNGIQWRNITVISGFGEAGTAFSASNNSDPADVRVSSGYSVIVTNCMATNVPMQSPTGPIAFVNCRFNIVEAGNPSFNINSFNVRKIGFFGTEIRYTSGAFAFVSCFLFQHANHILTLENCSICNINASLTTAYAIFNVGGAENPTLNVHGTTLGHGIGTGTNNGYLNFGASYTWSCGGNKFFGIDDPGNRWDGGTKADWITNNEPDLKFSNTHEFLDTSVSLDLDKTKALYTTDRLPSTFTPHIVTGVNGINFNSFIGAWQYGSTPNAVRSLLLLGDSNARAIIGRAS